MNPHRTNAASASRAIAFPARRKARQGASATPARKVRPLSPEESRALQEKFLAANPDRRWVSYGPAPAADEPEPEVEAKAPTKRRGKAHKDDRARALAVLAKRGVTDPGKDDRVDNIVDAYRNAEDVMAYHKTMGRIPPEKPGRPVIAGKRMAIGAAMQDGWTWREAAAAVFLFASDGRSYRSIWTDFKDRDRDRRIKSRA